ncbi:MAG: hypothetical protein CO030_01645 [Candidatus Magasanikbacteria bacterium CG_4_9_14_0_2_um_filter_42_11]|uniref:Uncharacterized protein n=1 Tax=Candidatus Magasanikbacteria bacterium CG_4_9_14_0_2_um_filter_42_11 TaxID=1974643 RepID=A0A2M8FAB2_9BACT|nr:MAG: hypothetical protein COU34_03825 [Candidatus Magasanikbacteria bacterium CG10_big_fil_rev_8_21_14_0_10_43_9]PIY92119.1 MAG: hypothetical protein COY70_04980 [Candidatus Magasanikbacteria bacterium CG_4_10_14_0_8_um_filter_42_12]PJC52675.1 MAG: hypothetical protein CO030_01645 [Candidatus Magasanikbacteria bacterium CG_4_9_14_0_2_um_filter_42_11]
MAQQVKQFSFLESQIYAMMDEAGLSAMSEETMNQFLPQFVAEAERRIGLAYTALLDEAGANAFAALFEKEDIEQSEIQAFLEAHVPNYQAVATKTLEDFAKEFKVAVAEIE